MTTTKQPVIEKADGHDSFNKFAWRTEHDGFIVTENSVYFDTYPAQNSSRGTIAKNAFFHVKNTPFPTLRQKRQKHPKTPQKPRF
jgi:hypothetical protein